MGVFCSECEKVFASQSTLNRHKRDIHKKKSNIIEYSSQKRYCCGNCNQLFKFNRDLRNHLVEKHDYSMESVELEFQSFDEFISWKLQEERENNIQYSKFRGVSHDTIFEKMYYECIRSSKSYYLKGIRQRALKSQGSCKMSSSCTSQIILKKNLNTDHCKIFYFKTHYGHGNEDIQHIRLTKLDRNNIASKLIIGVPPKSIINNVRDNISQNLKRVDLLTRADIRNIKKSYGIDMNEGCRHKDDATSVHLWVSECMSTQSSPILFYKPQNQLVESCMELKDQDFCLVFMNDVQKEMLTSYGKNLIAVDGTHGLNSYDFELTTLLVKDEFGNGFPVGFMFSNRKDTLIYKIFFQKIKEHTGLIKAAVFMTDITNTFYNAWCSVMEPVPYRLFCSWHVDRAWQVNFSKIRDPEKKLNTYKMLKELQYELNPEQFTKSLNCFLDHMLNDEDLKFYGNYFLENYCKNVKEWAYCYRKECGVNTNMCVESFHKVLKYFYLDGKKIRRLDKSIHQLILFLRDKTVERIIKLKKGKPDDSMITARHRCAVVSSYTIEQHNNFFSVQNHKNEKYTVTNKNIASCCPIMCKFCNICIHSYSCSCIDYLIRATICKHIHCVVLQSVNSTHYFQNQTPEDTSIQTLVSHIATPKGNQDSLKHQIRVQIQSVKENLDNNNHSIEQLKLILEHLNSASAVSGIPSSKFEIKDTKLTKEPGNKNIPIQKSFHSTRKQNKKTGSYRSNINEKSIVKELSNNEQLVVCTNPMNDHQYYCINKK